MSVSLSFRMEQLSFHWMHFSEFWYLISFRQYVEKIQLILKSLKCFKLHLVAQKYY